MGQNVVLEKNYENKSCWKLNFTWNTCLTCQFWTKIVDLAWILQIPNKAPEKSPQTKSRKKPITPRI